MTKFEFAEKFLNTFAKDISEKDRKKYGIGTGKKDYLWNLFAGKLIPCYEGDEARKMFDGIDKNGAKEIFYSGHNKVFIDDEEVSELNEKYKTADDIDKDGVIELYVFNVNFDWCYVITHELDLCGPYFCFKPNN